MIQLKVKLTSVQPYCSQQRNPVDNVSHTMSHTLMWYSKSTQNLRAVDLVVSRFAPSLLLANDDIHLYCNIYNQSNLERFAPIKRPGTH